MGPDILELLAPLFAFIGLGSAILIGMKMRYTPTLVLRNGMPVAGDEGGGVLLFTEVQLTRPLGRVLRLMVGVSDHDGDRVTDVAYGVQCQQWVRRRLVRLTVLTGDGPAADQPAHSGFRDVGTRVYSDYAGHLRCSGGVDAESGMGVR